MDHLLLKFSSKSILLHLVNARFGDFYAGMFHICTAIEYILPIIALGLWAGQQTKRTTRISLVSMGSAMIFGAAYGTKLSESLPFNYFCIGLLILLGILISLQLKVSNYIVASISILAGLVTGLANGAAWVSGMLAVHYTSGVVLSGIILMTLVTGLVLSSEKNWQQIAVRVVGSWIAALGIMYTPFLIMN
jgi:hydrogenase/urease accessory protein HupE